MEYQEIIDATARSAGGLDSEAAERAVQATLRTLAERLPGGEARHILRELPAELGPTVYKEESADAGAFGIDEFLRKVADRENTGLQTALRHARAVFSALGDTLSPDAVSHLEASLPQTFAPLLAEARHGFTDMLPAGQFWDRVHTRLGGDGGAGGDGPAVRRVTEAVLETLAERIAEGQVEDVVARLDPLLHPPLLRGAASAGPQARRMAVEEFLRRVAAREGATMAEADLFDQMPTHVRAVFATLAEAVGVEEWLDVTAQLPAGYRGLIPSAA
jgi:uncharacterized protein (DUF2267 family)